MAPLLFDLVAEGLTGLMREAVSQNCFRSLLVGKNKVPVDVLLYADDIVFFGEASMDPIISKFEAKLSKLNQRNISMAGRTTLINVVLTTLPLFYMSFFKVPSAFINRISAIQKQFLCEL